MAYVKILPPLYWRIPDNRFTFELLSKGMAIAIGPHMPIQWRLEMIPRINADVSSAVIFEPDKAYKCEDVEYWMLDVVLGICEKTDKIFLLFYQMNFVIKVTK